MRALALAVLLLPAAAAATIPVPPLTGPVVDRAGLLDASSEQRLAALARSARSQQGGQGVQLQYLIVPSLEGEPIEDFSIRVAEAWKIGSKGKDNGLLLVVAVQDRAYRIEVGGGLEGEIPDALARRVGDQILRPAFRAGRFGDGLYDAGVKLLGLAGVSTEEMARARGRGASGVPVSSGVVLAVMVALWVLGSALRGFGPRRRRHLWWGGGPWMGGGFGGPGPFTGGSGGGWSGGGGGFSGGGASGRW